MLKLNVQWTILSTNISGHLALMLNVYIPELNVHCTMYIPKLKV